jgi:hypothetical protein
MDINKQQDALVKAIGRAVGTRRSEVEALLIRSGVIVPEGASDAQVIRIVFMAIADSKGFRADFGQFLNDSYSNMAGMGYANFTFNQAGGNTYTGTTSGGYSTPDDAPSGVNWGKVLEATVALTTTWWNNRQSRLAAEAAAEEEARRVREEQERLAGGGGTPPKSGVNWVTVGIVTGVVALLGTTIFLVTRKK